MRHPSYFIIVLFALLVQTNFSYAQRQRSRVKKKKTATKIIKAVIPDNPTYVIDPTTGDSVCLDTLPLTDPRRFRWGDIAYRGEPWVKNDSRPFNITHGLYNRHISLWASHGRYFDINKGYWRWQRPNLYATTEDLFTQTLVIPYLIPMLEKAGAVVFTPRERDWQRNEVIIDNDSKTSGVSYLETEGDHAWKTTRAKGFAQNKEILHDRENPFNMGTSRMVRTTDKEPAASMAIYQPDIPESGRYAVYVSYQTLENSVDDAIYTVWHKGKSTIFKVNQQMGGGTWVYLGTFEFDKGNSLDNRVTLSNVSQKPGVVTTDAVRFGGGMGNIERGGLTSGLPRCLEGSRYYAQWAGMPDTIYSQDKEVNDYKDDINVRSLMTNYVGGGSCYMPTLEGLKVPIELSLGVHSDAGYHEYYDSLKSTLAICTTRFNDGLLNSGRSRYVSYEFVDDLLNTLTSDLKAFCGDWYNRGIWNRNYSESRRPEVPSAILETLSHQSFLDMRYGHDPNFRQTLARSVYKTILRHVARQHETEYVVAPLPPDNFRIELGEQNTITLSWDAVIDSLEETATPTGHVVYTSAGSEGFDNGVMANGETSHTMQIVPGELYRFRIAAVNAGGESMPSETLCAVSNPEATKTIAIVNGFQRLSSPAIIQGDTLHGFNLDEEAGLSLGPTYGWVGRQVVFERGLEEEEELFTGWSNDDFTGMYIAGNDKNYALTHAEAIMANGKYNIVSCSGRFLRNHPKDAIDYLERCHMADVLLGLQYNDGRSIGDYKSFPKGMQSVLREYTGKGHPVLASGACIGRDMTSKEDSTFLADILKCYHAGTYRMPNNQIRGMGTTIDYYNTINERHYAAQTADVMQATNGGFSMLVFGNGNSAGVAYQGNDYRAITLGIPFECIMNKQKRNDIMGGLIKFLME